MRKHIASLLILFVVFASMACKNDDLDFGEDGYQLINNIDYISNQSDDAFVKNIILIIGDGMGENHIKLAKKMLYNNEDIMDLDTYDYKSMMETSCLDNYVTDSAAAATALATGVKTFYQRVGMDKDENVLTTILDYAHNLGMSTGVLTDQTLYDATPAGYTGHASNRYTGKNEIIQNQIDSTVDVLMGLGANSYFEKSEEINNKGWTYITEIEEYNKTQASKLFVTFSDYSNERPTIYEMANKTIKILKQNNNGFFLMVECGSIDEYANDADCLGVAKEVSNLDKTLRVCLNYMRTNDNTLVVVLADHETGGLIIDDGNPNSSWFTEPDHYHTPVDVPVYAFGTRSILFNNKELQNTDIYKIFIDLLSK